MKRLNYLLLLINIVLAIVPLDSTDEHRIKCITPARNIEKGVDDCRKVTFQYVFKEDCEMIIAEEDLCGSFDNMDKCNKCAKLFKPLEKKELNVEEYLKNAKDEVPPNFNVGHFDL